MNMQYFRPGGSFFVGDCMPFYHQGVFHLFYLLDENHHQGSNGLGGHQWAHASTTDLVNWEQHEFAIPLDLEWEASICTGSVLYNNGVYHAFYAVRKADRTQHICHATSKDCVTFQKKPGNPILSAPEMVGGCDFRDPFVFRDSSGIFHMLITSKLSDYCLHNRGGCLLRYTSEDLETWEGAEVFLIPGGRPGYGCIPECPEIFEINGWYYLLFGLGLETHYRMSRTPMGPWHAPADDILGSRLCAVMKTASFGSERRIGVCWIGTRNEDKDNGHIQWGGNLLFREITQRDDGSLCAAFPEEMNLPGMPASPTLEMLTDGTGGTLNRLCFNAGQSQEVACLRNVPVDFKLSCKIKAEEGCYRIGFGLRGAGNYENSYDLVIDVKRGKVQLVDQDVILPKEIVGEFFLEIVCKGSIVDVSMDGACTLVNRLPQLKGESVFISCQSGIMSVRDIEVEAI
ncbi:MAG: family 43 glycosylhydrolase [Planctomycetes bacterium]|nr:family 43 glycosylhydrolase [Planctomycetota bacterium]